MRTGKGKGTMYVLVTFACQYGIRCHERKSGLGKLGTWLLPVNGSQTLIVSACPIQVPSLIFPSLPFLIGILFPTLLRHWCLTCQPLLVFSFSPGFLPCFLPAALPSFLSSFLPSCFFLSFCPSFFHFLIKLFFFLCLGSYHCSCHSLQNSVDMFLLSAITWVPA